MQSLIRNKRGETEVDESLELVIGGFALVILIALVYLLLSALGIGIGEKSATSYFETFMEEVEKADEGQIGEFILWQENEDEKENVFLIYFDDKYYFDLGDERFVSFNSENSVCVCSWDKDLENWVCLDENCAELSYPMKLDSVEGQWAIASGEGITIERVEDYYEVRKVNEE